MNIYFRNKYKLIEETINRYHILQDDCHLRFSSRKVQHNERKKSSENTFDFVRKTD